MSLTTLLLSDALEPALSSRHPWIYRNHLPKHGLQNGDWVRVRAGKAEAVGLYDEESAIALRLFGEEMPSLTTRVDEALALRETLFEGRDTTAYRLIYGEGDYLPGVTVDRYGRYAVLQTFASSVKTIVPDIIKALAKLRLRGVVTRTAAGLEPLWGEAPPPELTVKENGLKLLANLYEGQKTGLFLDHRDNRETLGAFCEGKRVLNLFSYTGAFSLYACRGGAAHVTSVDLAPAATEDAKRNFMENGFDPHAHTFLTEDCFALLERYAQTGERFDVVVLDPPSLARSKEKRFAARRAYRKLNALAARCVRPGGFLATASCTSQVSPADFLSVLGEAANGTGRRLQVVHEAGHAADHPVPATFPEGRYLKFVVARVL